MPRAEVWDWHSSLLSSCCFSDVSDETVTQVVGGGWRGRRIPHPIRHRLAKGWGETTFTFQRHLRTTGTCQILLFLWTVTGIPPPLTSSDYPITGHSPPRARPATIEQPPPLTVHRPPSTVHRPLSTAHFFPFRDSSSWPRPPESTVKQFISHRRNSHVTNILHACACSTNPSQPRKIIRRGLRTTLRSVVTRSCFVFSFESRTRVGVPGVTDKLTN